MAASGPLVESSYHHARRTGRLAHHMWRQRSFAPTAMMNLEVRTADEPSDTLS